MSTNVVSFTGMNVDISGNSDPRDISASIPGTMTSQRPIASRSRSDLLPTVWPASLSVLASASGRSRSHGPFSRTASVPTRGSPTSDSVSRLKDVEVGTFDGSKPWMISNSSIATFSDDYDRNTRSKREQRSSTSAASFGVFPVLLLVSQVDLHKPVIIRPTSAVKEEEIEVPLEKKTTKTNP
mmetsp:Transcript_3214/g.6839  ORF Transcript_3214/g.6839 Transcript_3214/m.6839 type:complete len:183 (+) Transcript_3214:2-550(+)